MVLIVDLPVKLSLFNLDQKRSPTRNIVLHISTTVKILILVVLIIPKILVPMVFMWSLILANLGEKPSLIEKLFVKSEILYYLPILWSLFSESLVL